MDELPVFGYTRIMHFPEYVAWGERTYGAKPVPVHRRSRWEFQIVHAGSACPSFPLMPPVQHSCPRLYCFSPEALHGWTAKDASVSQVSVIHFMTLPAPVLQLLAGSLWHSVALSVEESNLLNHEIKGVFEASKNQASMRCLFMANEVLWRIGRILLENPLGKSTLQVPNNDMTVSDKVFLVRRASAWLEEHMHENPGIDDVCRGVFVSRSTLHRAFQSASELTPMQTLHDLRMARAKTLLTATNLPISEIAYNLGYPSPGVFSRAFHTAEDDSPAEFRKHRTGMSGV